MCTTAGVPGRLDPGAEDAHAVAGGRVGVGGAPAAFVFDHATHNATVPTTEGGGYAGTVSRAKSSRERCA